jgi:hypothetical protein
MLFGGLLSLAVAGLATAATLNYKVTNEHLDAENSLDDVAIQPQEEIKCALAPSDAGSLSNFLTEFNVELAAFDQIIADITAENVNDQMNKWVAQGRKLAEVADRAAPSIKASGPVDIKAAGGLMAVGKTFMGTMKSTVRHIIDRRQIILDAKLQDKVKESLVNGKPAMLSMIVALPSQVPEVVRTMISQFTGKDILTPPTAEKAGPLVDRAVDRIFKVSIY